MKCCEILIPQHAQKTQGLGGWQTTLAFRDSVFLYTLSCSSLELRSVTHWSKHPLKHCCTERTASEAPHQPCCETSSATQKKPTPAALFSNLLIAQHRAGCRTSRAC